MATALSRVAVAPVPIATPLTTSALAVVPKANEISPAQAFTPIATAASFEVVSLYAPTPKFWPVNSLYALAIVAVFWFPFKSVYVVLVIPVLSTSSLPIAIEELPLAIVFAPIAIDWSP